MGTKDLYKRQGDFLTPATDTVPTLTPYDVNTPQAAREGLPLRMFDRIEQGMKRVMLYQVIRNNITKH